MMMLPCRTDKVEQALRVVQANLRQGMPYDEAHWWASQDLTPREAYYVTLKYNEGRKA